MKHWLIIFLLIISICSQRCGSQVDGVGTIGYYFHNLTGAPVVLKVSSIEHGDSLIFQIQNDSVLYHEWFGFIDQNPETYYRASILFDSLFILFDSTKCIAYKNYHRKNKDFCDSDKISRSPYCFRNYAVERGNEYYFQYYYFFTKEDFENAEKCTINIK